MKTKAIISFLVLLAFNINAQSRLTLKDCIERALVHNHEFKQMMYEKQKADEKVSEAYGSSLFPSIDGSLNYSRAVKRPTFIFDFMGQTQEFEIGSANTMSASLNLEQPLFSGAMFLAVRIAETYADMSKKALDYSESELILKVKQAYYTYLLGQKMVELAEQQLSRAEENLREAKVVYEAGLAAEYDYIQANVQYQNLIPQLTEVKNQQLLAKNNLLLIIGLNPNENIEINDSLVFSKHEIPEINRGIT